MKTLRLRLHMTAQQAEKLNKQFIDEKYARTIINYDCDGYDSHDKLLFKFRKNVIPLDVLKLGVDSFKDSIENTEGRGAASGSTHYRILSDGTTSKQKIGNRVESGNVGYMDRLPGKLNYCRATAFARSYFDKFQAGIPFVRYIDGLYAQLCPDHYARQRAIADATNRNYVIHGTSFTTVTVNKNFRTAIHKDSGDFMQGFGNLCCYRQGHYEGCYFCLPEYGVGFDLHNGDMLFVDVHKWHGNTPFVNADPDFLRISFVMYYRENMIDCKQPSDELKNIQHSTGNFFKI
jgi:hypothetical protein